MNKQMKEALLIDNLIIPDSIPWSSSGTCTIFTQELSFADLANMDVNNPRRCHPLKVANEFNELVNECLGLNYELISIKRSGRNSVLLIAINEEQNYFLYELDYYPQFLKWAKSIIGFHLSSHEFISFLSEYYWSKTK